MVFLKKYLLFVLSVAFLGVFFVVGDSFAQTCTVTRATGDTYTGSCVSSTGSCSSGQTGFIDGVSGCSFATDMCCASSPSGGFSCGTNTEKGSCKNDCGNGAPLSQYDYSSSGGTSRCPSVSTPKCCKAASVGGTCEQTTGQLCSADCSKETAHEAGGTGTCTDTTKSQCCKKKELCVDQGYASCEMTTSCSGTPIGQFDCPDGQTCCKTGSDPSEGVRCLGSENAGIVPCGRTCDDPSTGDIDETDICTLCHLLVLIRNITDWIFMVMTYIAFAVLVAMGILYIVSTGKPQLTGMAKNGIWAALVGFAIVLLGWVAINVVLFVLADGALGTDTANFSIKTNGKWFEYNCDTQTKYTGGTGGVGGIYGGDTGGGGGTVTCGEGGCAKDEKVKAAVEAQRHMPANDYMAILQAGEHYSEKTTCSNRSSPTGACGVSQTMPVNYKICNGGYKTCEEMRSDINNDIACGAWVAANFKRSHNVPCKQDRSKKIDCNIDGLKSLAGCYNRGFQCNISPRNVSGKWYDCGEVQGGKSYCDRVSEYANSCDE